MKRTTTSLLLLLTVSAAALGAGEKIIEETFRNFEQKSFSSNGIQADQNGLLVVRGNRRNNSEGILFRKSFSLPEENSGRRLRWSLTLHSFSDQLHPDKPESGFRFFLVPEPLPKHLEFYILPNAIGITLAPTEDKGCSVSLNLKENSKDGFGRPLYSCRHFDERKMWKTGSFRSACSAKNAVFSTRRRQSGEKADCYPPDILPGPFSGG